MVQRDAPFLRWLSATVVAVVCVVATAGLSFYRSEKQRLWQSAENELRSIAQLKAEQISQWTAKQLSDAAVIRDSPFLADAVSRWLAAPKPQLTAQLRARLDSLRRHYQYRDVLLVDAYGQLRISLRGYRGPIDDFAAQQLSKAFQERRPLLTDLHVGPGDLPMHTHTDTIAPLFDHSHSPPRQLGALLLQSDARFFLLPLIQSWPIPSETAEALLLRREGEAAVLLNDLRGRVDTAMKVRIPLDADDVAAMAVRGSEGTFYGSDYRGVQVLCVLRPLADTPWLLIAKVDAEEIRAPWRNRSLLIIAVLTLFALAAIGLIGMAWQRAGKLHFQAMAKAEAEKRADEQR